MARGNRSRSSHERTAEERERARQERAQRRAGRSPAADDPAPRDPALDAPAHWGDTPVAPGQEGAQELVDPVEEHHPAQEQHLPEEAQPLGEPHPDTPPAEHDHAPDVPPQPAYAEQGAPAVPPQHAHEESAPIPAESELASYDEPPASEDAPPAVPLQAAVDLAPADPERDLAQPEDVEPEDAEPEHVERETAGLRVDEPEPGTAPEGVRVGHVPAGAVPPAPLEPSAAVMPARATAPPRREPLDPPALPERFAKRAPAGRSWRSRGRSKDAGGAALKSAGGAGGARGSARLGLPQQPRPRRSRSALARIGALIALLAAIVAVVLLVRALAGSSHAKPVATVEVVKVLVPEGKTRAQIAQIASSAGLTGSYRAAAERSARLSPAHYGAPSGTSSLEGFLFPATYDIDAHAPAVQLVEKQLAAFRENFGATELARARALHVSAYGLLTVASMIEREAQTPSDRPKIAAVIYNRLAQHIPLGIDATIYYAVEQRAGIATYTHELTEAQLHINSPYNTRLHTGLPPTPISNPGAASIHAAAFPAKASYLYYVAGADGCGEQVFSTTLAAFEANAAAYQAAVRKNGGHPPSCKK